MATATLDRIWSPYQEAIFSWAEKGQGSAVIEAAAGAAKSTTIIEVAKRLPSDDSILFVAFNKRIADDLKRKLPAYICAMTLNALGFRAWRSHVGKNVEVDSYKVTALIKQMSDDSSSDFRSGVKKLVDLAKLMGIVPNGIDAAGLVDDDTETWRWLIDEYDIFFGPNEKKDWAIALARRVLAENIRLGSQKIDFNDQLYLPVIFGAEFTKYDWVFADEAQDISNLQLEMLRRSLAKNGRFVGVGDSAQAIYGWRGASRDAIPNLGRTFDAQKFPLSISYRCPRSVVALARKYSQKIEPWEKAADGKVEELESWVPSLFGPTDVILCRNNAPLVAMAFKLIRAGKPCKVLGRDIGTGLVSLVKRMRAISLDDLKAKLDAHVDRERKRLVDEPEKIVSLLDRVDTIRIFVSEMPWGTSVEQLCSKIEGMFAEDGQEGMLLLSTIHKGKGMEWPRVFILDQHLIGMREPEPNLYYVAVTRAMKELYFINSK